VAPLNLSLREVLKTSLSLGTILGYATCVGVIAE
jgi:hypothetical protein